MIPTSEGMWYIHNYIIIIPTGKGTNGNLTKVQFAQVVKGRVVYDDGENDHSVFGGKY